jgi:hypothetical protein
MEDTRRAGIASKPPPRPCLSVNDPSAHSIAQPLQELFCAARNADADAVKR